MLKTVSMERLDMEQIPKFQFLDIFNNASSSTSRGARKEDEGGVCRKERLRNVDREDNQRQYKRYKSWMKDKDD